jgi:hypothetical protein
LLQTQSRSLGLARSIDRIAEIWAKRASRLTDTAAILLILLLCATAAAIGAVPTKLYGHDIFIMLDAGWRVLNGQRPDVDFNPSMGPLLSLLLAAGLRLAHNSVNGVGYASALVGAVTGLGGYALSRRRLPAIPAMLTALALTLIAVAPFPVGMRPDTLSHAMVYNRYGYALLGLVVLECFRTGDATLFGGLTTGFIAIALLFLKPSYCLVALGLAGCSLVLARPSPRRLVGMLLGAIVASLAMMLYLQFDFAAVWNDLHLMSQARSSGLSLWNIRWSFLKGFTEFLPLGLLALLAAVIRRDMRPLFLTALLWIGGALLLATNAQLSGYPLNAVLAILLVENGRLANGQANAGFLKPETILVLLALVCYLPTAVGNAGGLAYALVEESRNPPVSVTRFHAAHMASLLLYDVPDPTDADQRSNGRVYITYVNNGMDLIRKVSPPTETVFTLDMVNPFPYALLRRPPRGGSPALAFNHTFNDEHKPSPDWLFGSADIVMVPKHPASNEADASALFRNYQASIQTGFRLCAESDWWQLYKRPGHLKGCSAVNAR